METLETIKSKIEEINQKKQELVKDLRSDFAPMLKPLFDKSNGKIKSLGWTQYTPYFNDGDECVFRVNKSIDYGIKVNGEYLEDTDGLIGSSEYALRHYGTPQYDSWVERYPEVKINEESKESDLLIYGILKEFSDLLESIDDEFFKDLFGDHVLVTVYADGEIETEEYEHD